MRTDANNGESQPSLVALGDAWMDELPQQIRQDFLNAKVRATLSEMPIDTPLSPDLAGLYLGLSDSTLKRMRASGKGPNYSQFGSEGSKSRNQKIIYVLGDLKEWIRKNSTTSTGHAAIRRGLMFASLSGLQGLQPWWVKDNKIFGHALGVSLEKVFEDGAIFGDVENKYKLRWLSISDALQEKWTSLKGREAFDQCFQALLENILKIQREAAAATGLEEKIG